MSTPPSSEPSPQADETGTNEARSPITETTAPAPAGLGKEGGASVGPGVTNSPPTEPKERKTAPALPRKALLQAIEQSVAEDLAAAGGVPPEKLAAMRRHWAEFSSKPPSPPNPRPAGSRRHTQGGQEEYWNGLRWLPVLEKVRNAYGGRPARWRKLVKYGDEDQPAEFLYANSPNGPFVKEANLAIWERKAAGASSAIDDWNAGKIQQMRRTLNPSKGLALFSDEGNEYWLLQKASASQPGDEQAPLPQTRLAKQGKLYRLDSSTIVLDGEQDLIDPLQRYLRSFDSQIHVITMERAQADRDSARWLKEQKAVIPPEELERTGLLRTPWREQVRLQQLGQIAERAAGAELERLTSQTPRRRNPVLDMHQAPVPCIWVESGGVKVICVGRDMADKVGSAAPTTQTVWRGVLRLVRRWGPGNTIVYFTESGSLTAVQKQELADFLVRAYRGSAPQVIEETEHQRNMDHPAREPAQATHVTAQARPDVNYFKLRANETLRAEAANITATYLHDRSHHQKALTVSFYWGPRQGTDAQHATSFYFFAIEGPEGPYYPDEITTWAVLEVRAGRPKEGSDTERPAIYTPGLLTVAPSKLWGGLDNARYMELLENDLRAGGMPDLSIRMGSPGKLSEEKRATATRPVARPAERKQRETPPESGALPAQASALIAELRILQRAAGPAAREKLDALTDRAGITYPRPDKRQSPLLCHWASCTVHSDRETASVDVICVDEETIEDVRAIGRRLAAIGERVTWPWQGHLRVARRRFPGNLILYYTEQGSLQSGREDRLVEFLRRNYSYRSPKVRDGRQLEGGEPRKDN
ncbi:hypothetical protein [Streptomyces sp. NPDC048419]|uniref:hypothetical protein n=1 Tax=Streptomyces sp. NPDC048419 TaxID=3365547 RepID=UPI00371CEAF4